MKTLFASVAICSGLLLAGPARAEWETTSSGFHPPRSVTIINWEISEPIGSFHDYIGEVSFRGLSGEVRSFVKPNLSAGIGFSFNRYEETLDKVSIPITNGTATGPVYRYADMFEIRALGHYYLMPGPLMPYAGVGIGVNWAYAYQQTADLQSNQDNFNFCLTPEVGVLWYLSVGGGTALGLNLALRYTYTTADVGKASDAQTVGAIVGLAFSY